MSTTKTILSPKIASKESIESQNTLLQLEVYNKKQNRKPIYSSAPITLNNFVACDRCFGYNPIEDIPLSYTYLTNICPECGYKGVRYISTSSNKLFGYVHKNIY
ncbi:MAG TPA: hypothetical protein VJR94_00965 [Candidatus Nitrosocosmicus sp.]|nr:hypothetical protein [Candidatus Nitrosocosmicus sp.]